MTKKSIEISADHTSEIGKDKSGEGGAAALSSKRPLEGKHIILGITGGIAAFKSATLLRLMQKAGAEVQVVITPAGKEFITPATLAALSGKPVVSEFFAANTGEWHSHVDLGLWADLMVVAPATASSIAKMAHGVADNMLITTYLSAKEQVMVAPAMDLDMWAHPTTQRNVRQLEEDGVIIVMPADGYLASGLVGKGRMAEPETIFEAVKEYFLSLEEGDSCKCVEDSCECVEEASCKSVEEDSCKCEEGCTCEADCRDMLGRRVLITAGPTYERIDPVRFIGNFSSGKMGAAIANECHRRGAEVTVVAGPMDPTVTLAEGIRRVDVMSAVEMLQAAEREFDACDYAVMAAAVADYAPVECADTKIKREGVEEMTLTLRRNPDIAATLGERKRALAAEGEKEKVMVGFALETDHGRENALSKMQRKGLDMIVLNTLGKPGVGFMTDTNQVTVLRSDGRETSYALKAKSAVARDIVDAMLGLDV